MHPNHGVNPVTIQSPEESPSYSAVNVAGFLSVVLNLLYSKQIPGQIWSIYRFTSSSYFIFRCQIASTHNNNSEKPASISTLHHPITVVYDYHKR